MRFSNQEDALIQAFDNGCTQIRLLTKEISEYKVNEKTNKQSLPDYQDLVKIEHRVGRMYRDYISSVAEDGKVKNKMQYVWRFVGAGRSCVASTEETLLQKITLEIDIQKEDKDNKGYNTYPYYTKYHRN